MRLAVYRFLLRATSAINFPSFPGIALRGGFGKVFFDMTCASPGPCSVGGCQLPESCPYGRIFQPRGEQYRRFRDLPRPFVFRPRFGPGHYPAGAALEFDLVLAGWARRSIPWFLVALRELGERGIGHRPPRSTDGRFRIAAVSAVGPGCQTVSVYSAQDNVLRPEELTWRFPDDFAEPILPAADGVFRIRFETPTHLVREGNPRGDLSFRVLIDRLLMRISLLGQAYDEGPALTREQEAELKALADAIEIDEGAVDWTRVRRYSTRRGQHMVFEGWLGEVAYRGDPGPFLPLLRLAELIGVGKHAAFGFGGVRMAG